jgi:hypothetical protein
MAAFNYRSGHVAMPDGLELVLFDSIFTSQASVIKKPFPKSYLLVRQGRQGREK